MNPLVGRTSLVTGASWGIGRATALALANAGAEVLVHHNRGAAQAAAVVRNRERRWPRHADDGRFRSGRLAPRGWLAVLPFLTKPQEELI